MKPIRVSIIAALLASSAGLHAQETNSKVEHCDRPLGTLAVTEAQSESARALETYGLGSPVALLRIMVQQSNCFQVVERGAAMANLQQGNARWPRMARRWRAATSARASCRRPTSS